MVLKDNSIFKEDSVKPKLWKQILSLIDQPICNLTGEGNLLVFPHSFKAQKDDLKDMCLFTRYNGQVMTTNLMGFVGIGGAEITIKSRFSNDNGEDYFLYYMLMKVMHINMFNLPHGTGDVFALDLLMLLFPCLLNDALSQGLYKEYRTFENNDARVRGVIDVNRFIREDIPFQGNVAYRTHEFSYDNKVTQLVRHTIEYLRHHAFGHGLLNNDEVTRSSVAQIINATPSYSMQQRQTVIKHNLKVVSHPYFTKYSALQKLCLQILRHEKISYGDNRQKIQGILFDGAWLWEEYISSVLSETFDHFTQKSSFYLFTKEDGSMFQQIIPDYLSKDWSDDDQASAKIVADAKYIPLADLDDHLSADRACAVYYKTIMYIYRFNSKNGYLFHPIKQSDKNKEHVSMQYNIKGCPGATLTKLGFCIPRASHFPDFVEEMNISEQMYKTLIV